MDNKISGKEIRDLHVRLNGTSEVVSHLHNILHGTTVPFGAKLLFEALRYRNESTKEPSISDVTH